jgi:hypothetical protein
MEYGLYVRMALLAMALGVELFLVDIRSGEIYNEARYSSEEGENGP